MRCYMCDGRGKTTEYDGLRKFWCDYKCDVCDGKGVVEPQTNEEWFCGLSTEEKARLLVSNKLFFRMLNYDGFVEWLKQPHKGE